MPNWDPNDDRASNLARGYARHLARIYGDDPLDLTGGRGCENCGVTDPQIVEIWTDDGSKPRLCEDCADEVRRMEKLADELAAILGCEERQGIIDHAETTAGLVNRLRSHDMSQCGACAALRRKTAMASDPVAPAIGRGKVA